MSHSYQLPRVFRSEAEEWRPAPGYEGLYEVSDLGRVRSLRHRRRIASQVLDVDGYPRVRLSKDGKQRHQSVHRLVALAFHGERKNILHNEVAHLDGSRANAHAANLKWVSKVENESHKRAHGTDQRGERHPRAKLTNAQALEIRRTSGPRKALADRYGISMAVVSDIRLGRSYRRAGCPG